MADLRTEVTSLGPDDPNQKPIGFTVREYQGVEISKYDPNRVYLYGDKGWDLEPITEETALQPGEQILVPGPTGGLVVMTVEKDTYGVLSGKSDQLSALLEFGKDDRHAWVCIGLVNLRGIERLKLER